MKERPVLVSGPLVRAYLSGKKTQTRRIVKREGMGDKPAWACDFGRNRQGRYEWRGENPSGSSQFADTWPKPAIACPYGQAGDRLWVRETFSFTRGDHVEWRKPSLVPRDSRVWYGADNDRPTWAETRWHPSIFMPRWASRLILDITDIRVERLQDISENDAIAEGTFDPTRSFLGGRGCFREYWIKLNGEDSWDQNPWVWVVETKRIKESN